MGNVILFIITMIIIGLTLYFIGRSMRKSNDLVEKICYIVLAVVNSTFLIIYYLDKFNIPTELGWNVNVNTQNWLSFIVTYATSIVSAGIAALVSVFITIYQIKKNNEHNEKRDKENLRIQNMPMLKYEMKTSSNRDDYKIELEHLIVSNCNEKSMTTYNLFILIKNIGLNNVKRIIIDMESSMMKKIYRILGDNNVVPLEKNEEKEIFRYFTLEREKEYLIKLHIYYEDVLQNWYYQVIEATYDATKYNDNSLPIGQINYKVNEEKQINTEDVPINNVNNSKGEN